MITYFDYLPEYRRLKSEIDAAIQRVLDSGRLILGAEVEAFEEEFAAYTGAVGAVGVASGTDSMILALKALEIGEGDEVITVANSGVPPIAAIRAAGATPSFVDVEADSLLLDASALERALTPRCRCIIVIHLYGRPVVMAPIADFAQAHDLKLIEDCSHAHGAFHRGQHVGSSGDIACFSFYPTKNLGAYGDGGLCLSGDKALLDRLRLLRVYGLEDGKVAGPEGLNSRLDELQAAILRIKLGHLEESLEMRRSLARLYSERLADGPYGLPAVTPGDEHAFHLFVIRCPDREQAISRLEKAGIGHAVHYGEPVHLMRAYRFLGLGRGTLPETERGCDEVLSLPLYPGLPEDAPERVSEVLLDA
jgi:dTDP-4-amino-4,6-dideoxygalactose transaminase